MAIFDTIIAVVFILYLVTSLLLLYGLRCSHRLHPNLVRNDRELPLISVLIAARNEEKRISGCIAALLQSDYPVDRFEIIIIDDRSQDGTLPIAQAYARNHANVRVVSLHQRLEGMSGKASALCQGIEHARGDIFLVTDADCLVPPSWMPAMVSHFLPEVGLVGGFTLLSPSQTNSLSSEIETQDGIFAKVQTLDWMYLLTAGAGAAGLGKPVSILGNNFGFRRAAYEQVGGYRAIGFTIIEDFALMQKIERETDWTVRFPLDRRTAIFSFPAESWRFFFDQRQRWAAGGKEVGLFAKYLMLTAFLMHITVPVAALFSPLLALCGLFSMLSADLLLLWRCASKLGRMDLLKHFLLFEIYFFTYSLVLAGTVALPATVHWKGVRYRWSWRGKVKSVEERPV